MGIELAILHFGRNIGTRKEKRDGTERLPLARIEIKKKKVLKNSLI